MDEKTPQRRASRPPLEREGAIRAFAIALDAASRRAAPSLVAPSVAAPSLVDEASADPGTPDVRAEADGAPAASADAPFVARGVATAYEVIDEYFSLGRRAQRVLGRSVGAQLHGALPGSSGRTAGASDRQQRFVMLASELVANWVSLMSLASDAVLEVVEDIATPLGDAAAHPPAAAQGPKEAGASVAAPVPSVSVEVASRRVARINVRFEPGTACEHLVSLGLRGVAGAAPPIPVAWSRLGPGHVLLRVVVPEDQDEGVYADTILDAASGRPVGTLCLTLQ